VYLFGRLLQFLSGFFLRFTEYKINVQDFELMLKCIQTYLTNGDCSVRFYSPNYFLNIWVNIICSILIFVF